ncbi:diguanylate cyclase [Marinibactrum halimedae]|uniref:Diguanylate cyclase response regulator n=1 Tax=Marinibactrum halimedae TaxID=1444977 RepID=A0AA37T5Z6_9GAMM|nr:diguanylate cyclase [Marinibactrum halimedae]MCD9457622.1 diguanylate cyclase [Marinibactrum halimedae]GLS28043.1 diguanylate cyclase response regulator [Marinibactrum halimedae]
MALEHDKESNTQMSRLLICDDSRIVRATAKKMLSERFDLVFAENGEQGWDFLMKDPTIQVVFTDLKMPELDGIGLIERIRHHDDEKIRNLPIIVITGASDDEHIKRQIFDAGATDFVTKPFTATILNARADAHSSYRKINHTLQESSNLDPVTGLYNQAGFNQQLKKDISFVNRHGETIAMLRFEVDHFDQIHKALGQKATDLIVKEISKLLSASLRKEDSAARLGLATFVVSLPMAKNDGVLGLARRLLAKVNSFKLKVSGRQVAIKASAGISTHAKGSQIDTVKLMLACQQALENAKAVGPGEVQLLKVETPEAMEKTTPFSMDALWEQLQEGQCELSDFEQTMLVKRMVALASLLSEEQKADFISQLR